MGVPGNGSGRFLHHDLDVWITQGFRKPMPRCRRPDELPLFCELVSRGSRSLPQFGDAVNRLFGLVAESRTGPVHLHCPRGMIGKSELQGSMRQNTCEGIVRRLIDEVVPTP